MLLFLYESIMVAPFVLPQGKWIYYSGKINDFNIYTRSLRDNPFRMRQDGMEV